MSGDVRARMVVHRDPHWSLDVDLTLPAGTTTALVGPNGAGKTTVLEGIAGLLPLDHGDVVIGDRVVLDRDTGVAPRDRRVGMVFQDGRLFEHLTVRDNVAFGPRTRGGGRTAARQVADDWMARVGIAALADRHPGHLSGGQAQRVALCRALAASPDVLLLDEPLSALDVQGRASLRRVLARHLEDLIAPRLLVTHDPVEAFLLADRIVVLEDGRVTQTGTPAEVRQHPMSAWAGELVGTNLLRGHARDGVVDVDGHPLHVAVSDIAGPVVVTIPPRAVALSPRRVEGSPRNTWHTTVTRVDDLGDRARISTAAPLPVTAEVTPAAVADLELRPGTPTWVAIKATEITVTPDGPDRPDQA